MKHKRLALLFFVALSASLLLFQASPNADAGPSERPSHQPLDKPGARAEGVFPWNGPKVGDQEALANAKGARRKWQNKVINQNIQAAWVSDHEAIFRFQQDLESWEFRIANAKNGKVSKAFDHQKVAKALGVKDANRLPLGSFKADKNKLYGMKRKGEVVVINRKDSTLETLDPKEASPLDLEPSRKRRSDRGSGDSRIFFVNTTASDVELFWIAENGNATSYGKLGAGETKDQHSFAGHLWRVKDSAGKTLAHYQAAKHVGIARIKEAPAAAAPSNKESAPRWRTRWQSGGVGVKGPKGDWEAIPFKAGKDRYLTGSLSISEDGRFVHVISRKNGEAHPVTFVESSPKGQVQPKVHTFDYTKPGDRIRHDRVLLYDRKEGREVAIDHSLFDNPWSLRNFAWGPDNKSFSFIYNQRGHQILRLIRVDAKSGKAKAVIEEAPKTFVDYSQKTFLYRFPGKDEAIWMSERDGWNHLYWVDTKKGRIKNQATNGKWVVRSVERVDPSKGKLWITAMGVHEGEDPYHRHFGVVDYKRGSVRWLTKSDGHHEIEYSPKGEYILDRYSRVDLAPVVEVRDAHWGKEIATLAKADSKPLKKSGWVAPERFVAKGRDGKTDIHGYILFPSWMKKGQKYPVIESIYAGPHGHHVAKNFSVWRGQRELSELGFVVVKIDGMGTNWRSKAFHDVCWKNIGDGGFPDRIKWMQAAAKKYPEMDLSRVGIYGGSAGGQNAMRAMLAHGDFYKAAAADCGCHDNRMDKIWWNEAWMGWPIGPHYAEQSNVTQAHKLEGALLLTVGEVDRNVDPASTMQVVDALIKADKDFDLIVFPSGGHGAGSSSYGRRRRADFFVRHLASPR